MLAANNEAKCFNITIKAKMWQVIMNELQTTHDLKNVHIYSSNYNNFVVLVIGKAGIE